MEYNIEFEQQTPTKKPETYCIILIDHSKIERNLNLYYSNTKYDHEQFITISHITNDYERALNKLNTIVNGICALNDNKLNVTIVNKDVIQIFDRSSNWFFGRLNKLLYTCEISIYH